MYLGKEKVLRLLCHSPAVGLEVIPLAIGDLQWDD
jgi:hypothetical protein